MRGWVFAFAFLYSFGALASPPTSREQYCELARDLSSFKALAADTDNLLAFTNYGGLLDGGVCWWHSRFQRAALLLAVYRPDLPRPSDKEAGKIIDAIAGKKRVVEIPGFSSLREFSAAYEDRIQARLEKWQKVDGFLKQYWIDGLWGSTSQAPEKLAETMDRLYERVETRHEIVYAKLQMPGIVSHSLLVLSMERTGDGYAISVLDSNSNGIERYDYRRGMTSFDYGGYGEFVPYARHDGELVDAQVEMLRYCNPKVALEKWEKGLAKVKPSLSHEQRQLIDYNVDVARRTGKFGEVFRQLTLEPADREPGRWRELISTSH
jgi:hypothetical protein